MAGPPFPPSSPHQPTNGQNLPNRKKTERPESQGPQWAGYLPPTLAPTPTPIHPTQSPLLTRRLTERPASRAPRWAG
eukprot:147727-Chlamydomonas_euryale.AAC.1